MRKRPDILPYRGTVVWVPGNLAWTINVATWEGGQAKPPRPTDMFDEELLRMHLLLADMEAYRMWVSGQNFHVTLGGRVTVRAQARVLVAILRESYSHYKGRPITWRIIGLPPRQRG